MEKIEIDGVAYDMRVIKAFCNQPGREFGPEFFAIKPELGRWYWDLIVSHLETFVQGWHAGYEHGYEVASSEAPDCDECDVHAKAAERGPPESHYSQQDR